MDWARIRANPSIDIVPFANGLSGYELATANNLAANGTLVPQLNLIVVPEPDGLVLALMGICLLSAISWMRRIRIRRLSA